MIRPSSATKSNLEAASEETKRIMIFGTFDIVHKGHEHFFKQARALAKNPFLIVSIARDANVKRIKGRAPRRTQSQRASVVKASELVDKVVIGGAKDHIPHIIKQRPDIIALGYDQTAYVLGLRSALKKAGLVPKIIRLKAYKPHKYKTSLIDRP
jgi:FAD synthetase